MGCLESRKFSATENCDTTFGSFKEPSGSFLVVVAFVHE